MSREPTPTHSFALVVVRKGNRFLLVQERKHGHPWYLPAGRVDPGEDFVIAAQRETLEEAGIAIRLLGVLRVEYTPAIDFARLRVVFLGEPIDDTPPKSEADHDSLQARWVTLEDLADYELRGAEVRDLLAYVAGGAPVYPLSVLQPEMMPYGSTI
jgi:8-oxo-dGTP pyrophosphatase MutT (NUDIX family)